MKDNDRQHLSDVLVGKDILELVSSAMYVDPLTIFREYVQNAADSIDDAKSAGNLKGTRGKVWITLDLSEQNRSVKIRDNGAGVRNKDFARRLMAVGASRKRGTLARGFRGVGRLAGLGYCQELVFRSRSNENEKVYELRWDCRRLRKLLADHAYSGSLHDIIQAVTSLNILLEEKWPRHFFEVELVRPSRIKSDLLLNREVISNYLAQVGPVPFSTEFQFGQQIRSHLAKYLASLGEVEIYVDGASTPLYRPYRNNFSFGDGKQDSFSEPDLFVVEGNDGSVSAVGWLLHHSYLGSIPKFEGIAGLRARLGNIQIGDHRIFSDVFPEARFASWAVGEVHVIDRRLLPNGRRDEFEQNSHYRHLLDQLSVTADQIAKRCRSSSILRNRLRIIDLGMQKVEEHLGILKQGAIGTRDQGALVAKVRSQMFELKKSVEATKESDPNGNDIAKRFKRLEKRVENTVENLSVSNSLKNVRDDERRRLQKVFSLIYECSVNQVVAKTLVDRILARLGTG